MTIVGARVLGGWGVWLLSGALGCAAGEQNDGIVPEPSGESGSSAGGSGSTSSIGGETSSAGTASPAAGSGGSSSTTGGTFNSGGSFGAGGSFGTSGSFTSGGTFGTAGTPTSGGQTSGGMAGMASGGGGASSGAAGNGGTATAGTSGGDCQSVKLTPTGATASGMERADLGPQFAIDGDTTTTRWASEQMNDAAWMMMDLGEVATVKRVVIVWEPAYATSYKVQIASNAAGPFQDLFEDKNGDGGTDDVATFTAATGRYVRMQGVTRKTMYGYSMWEMTVYGDKDETCD